MKRARAECQAKIRIPRERLHAGTRPLPRKKKGDRFPGRPLRRNISQQLSNYGWGARKVPDPPLTGGLNAKSPAILKALKSFRLGETTVSVPPTLMMSGRTIEPAASKIAVLESNTMPPPPRS